jgi:phosphodiesterase/alkaline phosphatase D-like protein
LSGSFFAETTSGIVFPSAQLFATSPTSFGELFELTDATFSINEQVTKNNLNTIGLGTDSILIRIRLRNIPDSLTFSQSHVGDYYNDYIWAMLFDVDGDPTTGTNGCEIEIELTHYKKPGERPFVSTIINGTSHVLVEWVGNYGYYRHEDVKAWIDSADPNTVVIAVPKSWSEVASINQNTRFHVYAFYYSVSGPESDETNVASGGTISDPVGDAAYDFIDIVSGSWNLNSGTSTSPTVTTSAATSVTSSSATLNATVNPNGLATTAYFEWGTSSTLTTSTSTASQTIGSGTTSSSVTQSLTGLTPSTAYYYRVLGQNSAGTQRGSIVSLTTSASASAPTVTTSVASSISSTSATLNGTVNPNGSSTTVFFEWGTSSTLATSSTTSSQSIGSGTSSVSVTVNLTALSASTTYYHRIVGQNSAGTSRGSIVGFTTLSGAVPNPPTLSSPADGATNQNTRPTLSWTASTGATNYHLQVAQSSLFSATVFDDTTITTTSRQVGPLQNNRTHYWRVRAKNTSGWSEYSTVFSFGTLPPPAFSSASIRNSFTSPGSRPTGLAWDGTNLWMIDNLKNVYRMDTSGTVLSSFTAPGFPDLDLSWDGTGLWIGGGQGYGSGRNMKVDALGNRVDSLDVSHWAFSGFEWDGKFFWISDYNSSLIYKHARNGTPLLNFGVDISTARPNSISYDGINLWIGSPGNYVSKYSTSGQFLYRANLNSLGITSTTSSVVAWDGQSLWIAKTDQFTIYRLNAPYYHTPPAAPVLVSPADGATGQPSSLTLSWQVSLEAATYRLQVSTSTSFATRVFDDSTITGISQQVSGLASGTTYYWRVNAKNSGGTSAYSSTWSFTPTGVAVPPTVTTNTATNVGSTSATLNGTVSPNGQATTASFEWGTNSTLATSSATSPQSIGSGTSSVSVTANLTGLSASTTYYYRVVGQNSAGTQQGSIVSFVTSASGSVPTATTDAPSGITTTSAVSRGTVNPNGLSTTVTFQYGTTTGYGSTATATQSPVSGSSSTSVSATLTGFSSGTTYHYRVVATNSAGTTNGTDQTFVTYSTSYTAATTVSFPSRGNASSYGATDYRIIGLPGASSASASSILSGTQNVDWQVYWDNGASSNFLVSYDGSANFNFTVGKAFWVISKMAVNVNRSVTAATLNASQEAEIPLQSGWNLITNPFTSSIAWSRIQTTSGTTGSLYSFAGSFSSSTSFDPYVGYYYFNGSPNPPLSMLRVPYASIFGKLSDVQQNSPGSWKVNVALKSGDIIDRDVWFGVDAEAKQTLDQKDLRKPRGVGALVEAYFDRPEWDAQFSEFASDIRSNVNDVERWEFTLNTPELHRSSLTLSGVDAIPGYFSAYLIDETRAKYVDLRRDSVYEFVPAVSRSRFSVLVGKQNEVTQKLQEAMLKEFELGQNFPNPFNPTTTILVSVPLVSEAQLIIYNILGQKVKTLYSGTLEAGKHWFQWDGKEETGNAATSGIFFYRLIIARGKTISGRMILMR